MISIGLVQVRGMVVSHNEQHEIENKERREVLASLLKYSAAVGGASTVVLSASEAVARSAASGSARKYDHDRWEQHLAEKKEWFEENGPAIRNYLDENPEKKSYIVNFLRGLLRYFS